LALVKFIHPFSKITGGEFMEVEARNVGELCRKLIELFGPGVDFLLNQRGEISKELVILVDRRNIHTLAGADTPLEKGTEVLIMPHIIGG
jgi:adenylyltransferase/sulfurtransferase